LQEAGTQRVALAVLDKARQENMRLSVDPSSTSLLNQVGPQRFLEWTRGADICFPNMDEGRLLTGETSPEGIVRFLVEWYGEVVLKLGGKGAIWARRNEPVVSVPAVPVQIVDSTGAGDAFCAGFLGEWLKGASPGQALQRGTRLGALVAGQAGARPTVAMTK
jgi:sugar/nucleoside kinase (ribokinase family)